MNRKNGSKKRREALNTRAAKVGGYSFIMGVFVLAILIAVNVAVSALPSTWTKFDISATQLYSVTSATKAVAQNLTDDVTIYWITQDGMEDSYIENLLDVYDSLSSHLSVKKTNPDIYPTFAAQYTDETVENNSIVVECGDRYRYVSYEDFYDADFSDYYTTGSAAYYFDGEGRITTAIDYVTSDDLPSLYVLTGHGEADLSETFTENLEKQNIETEEFSLLTVDEIPEDADAILIHAPSSDLSGEETEMLADYVADGGKLLVISGPQDGEELTNLHSLIEHYGVTAEEGIVVEGSRNNYAFGYPYVLLPELGESEITEELSGNNSYIIVPLAQGLTIGSANSGAVVTSLLDTTEESFSKVDGYALTTYEMEEDDIPGGFSTAVSIEDESGGMMVWISSDYIMDETYIAYSSGANADFVMNSLSFMMGESDAIAIRAKSLNYSYLTISTSQATMIEICLIGLIPVIILAFGAQDTISRRRKA